MAGYGQSQDQLRALVAEAKKLTVDKLKHVLRQENLTVSGIKSELQIRIIAHIEQAHNAGDLGRLERIRSAIRGIPLYNSSPGAYPSPFSNNTPTSSVSPQFSSPVPRFPHQSSSGYMMSSSLAYSNNKLTFKPSPFYRIIRPLTNVVECKERESTRDTARVTINLTPDTAEKLQRDEDIRVMIFCAANAIQGLGNADIAFPHQVELKCNSDEIKANLRGLKNKPGSTRPVDVTKFIRKKPNYPNLIEMVYALTTRKFYLVVNLVQKKSIDMLVSDLSRGKFISKERVITEMRSKAKDVDIVATSSVLSLKCPLSFTRIKTPCRSMACNHNQCFDAASYLQLQEQAPTWTCPICNRAASWDDLVVDLYFQDILNSTSTATEQVTVDPDGHWHKTESPAENPNSSRSPTFGDDDDFIEIADDRITSLKTHTPLSNGIRTPPVSSRDGSRAPSASKSQKRPREVIDLTLSDEDDEDAQPAKIKRTSLYSPDAFRIRSSDPYTFQMPPPNTSDFTYDRFDSSF